jgi:hypothetical protein
MAAPQHPQTNHIAYLGRGSFATVVYTANHDKALKAFADPSFSRPEISIHRAIEAKRHTDPDTINQHFIHALFDLAPNALLLDCATHGTLHDAIQLNIPTPYITAWAIHIAQALQHLHTHFRILHTDIKPTNIFMFHHPATNTLRAKLADLSSVVSLLHPEPHFLVCSGFGATCDRIYAPAIDIYAWGTTFAHALLMTQQPKSPYTSLDWNTATQERWLLLTYDATPLAEILLRAMDIDPEQRPPIDTLLEQLSQLPQPNDESHAALTPLANQLAQQMQRVKETPISQHHLAKCPPWLQVWIDNPVETLVAPYLPPPPPTTRLLPPQEPTNIHGFATLLQQCIPTAWVAPEQPFHMASAYDDDFALVSAQRILVLTDQTVPHAIWDRLRALDIAWITLIVRSPGMAFRGSLNPSSNLTLLEHISLVNQGIDQLPEDAWRHATSLRRVNLSCNRLRGALPVATRHWARLQSLNLSRNPITHVDPQANPRTDWPLLREANFRLCRLATLPSPDQWLDPARTAIDLRDNPVDNRERQTPQTTP